jgi:exosortase A-associated hydrolase 1
VTYTEQALAFECAGERLIGVVAQPADARDIGVVIVVGGPQYRAGSHRQFVLIARALAATGFAVLRFDCRGMGDSTGPARTFEHIDEDIAAAIAALQAACPRVARVVLWGLCDAASAALLYQRSHADPRLAGLVLLNPWVRSDATLARAHLKHHYRAQLLDPGFWRRLVRGDVAVGAALRSLAGNILRARAQADAPADSSYQDRMADGMRAFGGPILLVLCGRDLTAQEFVGHAASDARWAGLLTRALIERYDVAEADHTFSTAAWRDALVARTLDWLATFEAAACRARDRA